MQYEIEGKIAQYARLSMDAGETAWASNGSLMSYTSGVEWGLKIPGGMGGALQRSMAGEQVSLGFIESQQANQEVLLVANEPGLIIPWDLADGAVVTTRGSFLAAWGSSIDIRVTVARKAGAAMFGGAGLFLQKVTGSGTVLVHGSGDCYARSLAQGETLMVSTGNLAAFSEGVDYDIQTVGSMTKMMFGGEGVFLTRLTGPGRVLLQSLKRSAAI